MSIKIRKLEENETFEKNPNFLVKLTTMGDILQEQYMSHRNNKATIQMLPGGMEYVELSTGEIKQCVKHDLRSEQSKSLYRTFNTLRGIINSNITDVNNVRWITLTYAENMTNTKQLKTDFNSFNKRFQYLCKKNGWGKPEYITMVEPQGRGAWHHHLLYIWDTKAPFIDNNSVLQPMWGNGWTKIKKLDDVDNVGAYLTAYLGDMDMDDMIELRYIPQGNIHGKIKEVDGEKKFFVKGARLRYYPANFNMFRCSRGVKRPTVEMVTQNVAKKKVSSAKLTYSKTVELIDNENDFKCIISTKQYNRKRTAVQC